MRVPIAALLVAFGWGTQAAAPEPGVSPRPAAPARPSPAGFTPSAADHYVHTIALRDTLIGVSHRLLADPRRWPVLQRLNRVRNPRRLRSSGRLDIPVALLRSVPVAAEVQWVRGAARVRRPDGTDVVAILGATLDEGARVTTGAGEAVGVRLTNGAMITIGEDADVAFTQLRQIPAAAAARTGLELRRGRIQNVVAPGRTLERFEIRTPVATTAVRGTTFRVGVDAAGSAALAEVADELVGVARADEAFDVVPVKTRSWWWVLEPVAVLTGLLVAANR